MDIDEARKILWLRNYPRPLGELFDEGYMNRGRLEWAVKKADDPQLREAAKVLLALLPLPSSQNTKRTREPSERFAPTQFDVGISLEKARSKPWPFGPNKSQPMGDLIASRQISLKDLAYAIENAFDESVRKAATALLLERLEQVLKEPQAPTGLMRVTSAGRSYSERKQAWLTYLEGIALGIIVALIILIGVWSTINTFKVHTISQQSSALSSQPLGIGALSIAIAIALGWIIYRFINFILDKITNRLDKLIELYRVGEEGEDRTLEVILQALDGTWQVFRNVRLPGRDQGDLDLILVGPPGVWVLEVKNLRGEYRNIGDKWELKVGRDWKTSFINPSRQAHDNAARLGGFFKADGLNIFANAAVVWANPSSSLSVENPWVSVWSLERLPDELGNIWQSKHSVSSAREKIISKLEKLCERQRRSDSDR